ncbi:hypothetical protein [Methylobacterium pseudosasicola]|uniref:hypothetical protein n=1 Tax=Methylobacterium pseudosasicola TaxID=582667 RepID=UPI000B80CA1C|nr:hypothetical protein [Methylobacterium pseudosasicola]
MIAFAAFMFAIGAAGFLLWQRRRKAQRTGTDPLYAVASLDDGELDRPAATPRARGTGTTSE